jgi:hypothetical protein
MKEKGLVKQEDAENLVEAVWDNQRDRLSKMRDEAFCRDTDSSRNGRWLC